MTLHHEVATKERVYLPPKNSMPYTPEKFHAVHIFTPKQFPPYIYLLALRIILKKLHRVSVNSSANPNQVGFLKYIHGYQCLIHKLKHLEKVPVPLFKKTKQACVGECTEALNHYHDSCIKSIQAKLK